MNINHQQYLTVPINAIQHRPAGAAGGSLIIRAGSIGRGLDDRGLPGLPGLLATFSTFGKLGSLGGRTASTVWLDTCWLADGLLMLLAVGAFCNRRALGVRARPAVPTRLGPGLSPLVRGLWIRWSSLSRHMKEMHGRPLISRLEGTHLPPLLKPRVPC